MAAIIELPQVGESVVEGTIGKWLKQPGDSVERFEPLVEVVTDKVTIEVPSPVGGKLLRVLAQEGETLPTGTPIAEVETSDAPAQAAVTPPSKPAPARSQPAAQSPVSTTGYLVKDVRPVGPTGGGPVVEQPMEGPRLSPAVRRLVREHGIDPSQIRGTGMGGRVTRDDVLRYIEQGQDASKKETAPQPATGEDEEHVPLTPVRRMIAEAMVRSTSQIPHAWSTVEADVTGLVALRSQERAAFEKRNGVELTYLPFVIKTLAECMKEHPTLNASWGGDKIILKKRVNVGIAVAAPDGLVVPVIREADRMSLAELARAARDLTERARQRRLTLEDVHGGTFTLNNTGALGSIVSMSIINPPQAAILTTEAVQKRPVVRDEAIAIRSIMNLCLSFDHRVNDGAEAGAFLQAVKSRMESIGPGYPIN